MENSELQVSNIYKYNLTSGFDNSNVTNPGVLIILVSTYLVEKQIALKAALKT